MASKKNDPAATFQDDNQTAAAAAADGPMDQLSPEVCKMVEALIVNSQRMKMDQEALKDDFGAVAAKMGCKPAAVRGLVGLVIQEREKGGVIQEKERSLEWAKQVADGNSE